MPKQELGEIEDVPLRDVFADERSDFTPWLYENLNLLGDAISLELTPVEREGAVGSLSVDIVATSELGDVVIENQLGKSDHDHLGKLVSYAAGRDARFLIWVARTFKEEHKDSIDWLNRWMPEDLGVYGVEFSLMRINDSQPAPTFRIVASPDAPSSTVVSTEGDRQTGDEESSRRVEFFDQLVREARARDMTLFKKSRSAAKSKSFPCGADVDGIKYWVDLLPEPKGGVTVKLDVRSKSGSLNTKIVEGLRNHASEIERELGFEPEFSVARVSGNVQVSRGGSVWDQPAELDELRRWILDSLEAFQRVLDHRVAEIINELDSEQADGVEGGLGGDGLE